MRVWAARARRGAVDAHSADHSRQPIPALSGPVAVLANLVTMEKRLAICSTNLVDPTWARITAEIHEAGRQRLAAYVRMGQWKKVVTSTYDRLASSCADAALYQQEMLAAKAQALTACGPISAAMPSKTANSLEQFPGQDALASQYTALSLGGSAGVDEGKTALPVACCTTEDPRGASEPPAKRQRSRSLRDAQESDLQTRSSAARRDRSFERQFPGNTRSTFCSSRRRDGLSPREPVQLHHRKNGRCCHFLSAQVLDTAGPPFCERSAQLGRRSGVPCKTTLLSVEYCATSRMRTGLASPSTRALFFYREQP